ncbi:uncharacterized protein LOC135112778 [Scylla paramamosain]|uniref:uncharacterized protein LOC135112778 n=1 Tax=Scylla paramamosain TaxID=85552 RepID=UPI003082B789
MPTPRVKNDASLHSMAPSNNGKKTSLRCPIQASAVPTNHHVTMQKGTQTEGMMEPQTHPMEEFKKDRQVQSLEVTCNCCIMKVKGSDALGHLFFGRLKCANCMFIISQCQRFKKIYPAPGKCPKTQKAHSLTQWVMPTLNYLSYCARRETVISGFYENDKSNIGEDVLHDIIASYLRSLLPLKNLLPWKSAFTDPSIQTIMKTKVLVSQPQKSEPEDKVVQQSQTEGTQQVSLSSTSSSAHAAPKFSPLKRKMVQERDNQQSTPARQKDQNNPPVITHATRASQQKAKVKEEESSKMKYKDPPPAIQAPKKSTPQKRKTQQNSTKDTSQDTTMANNTLVVTKRTSDLSEENSSDLSQVKKERKPGKGNKKPYLDIIPKNVLHSMNYLVVQLSAEECLEECPNCYCPFNAEMCCVNISSLVIDFLCPNCDLAVYVMPEELYSEPA